MSLLEEIAVLDLKFRIVVAVGVVVFAVVGLPLMVVMQSALGALIGAIAGVVAAILTARRLSSG